MAVLPVVDLDKATVLNDDDELDIIGLQPIGAQLVKAFSEIGFVYITNHGIPETIIDECLSQSQQYFELPLIDKMAAFRNYRKEVCGYIPTADVVRNSRKKATTTDTTSNSGHSSSSEDGAVERFDLTKPSDLKELLDVCHNCKDEKFPVNQLPNFKPVTTTLMHYCQKLLRRMLLLLGKCHISWFVFELSWVCELFAGVGLELQDPLTLYRGIRDTCSPHNSSQLRMLYYPQVDSVLPGQLRCGEHTDYGMLTFVLVDTASGLEVKNRHGEFVKADYIQVDLGLHFSVLLSKQIPWQPE